ncbi:unnamed protein product [Amaranthus hypochondriacus]
MGGYQKEEEINSMVLESVTIPSLSNPPYRTSFSTVNTDPHRRFQRNRSSIDHHNVSKNSTQIGGRFVSFFSSSFNYSNQRLERSRSNVIDYEDADQNCQTLESVSLSTSCQHIDPFRDTSHLRRRPRIPAHGRSNNRCLTRSVRSVPKIIDPELRIQIVRTREIEDLGENAQTRESC